MLAMLMTDAALKDAPTREHQRELDRRADNARGLARLVPLHDTTQAIRPEWLR